MGNCYARNVAIFSVDNSSSSRNNYLKYDFLILGEGDTFGINGSFGAQKNSISINFNINSFSINFSKRKAKFYLSLHYNGDNSYLFINVKEIH